METTSKVMDEFKYFDTIWKGGYYEGDPLDPMGSSGYGLMGYMSVLHVVYLACIKPYVSESSVVLEIGPGRGAWTKTFLHCKAKEICCLDVVAAEYSKFWEYIDPVNKDKIKYIQIKDLTCNDLPDNKFNYFFSFGTFCHISFTGMEEYLKNIYSKLVCGSHCFIMIADYEKVNTAIRNIGELSAFRVMDMEKPKKYFKKNIINILKHLLEQRIGKKQNSLELLKMDENNDPGPGRWYHAGIKRTCDMLEGLGYKVIDPDMGVLTRDPIIHFCKPKL